MQRPSFSSKNLFFTKLLWQRMTAYMPMREKCETINICHNTCLCHLDLLWCHLRDFPAVADSSGAALITGVPSLRHRSSVARRPLPGQQLRTLRVCALFLIPLWLHCTPNTVRSDNSLGSLRPSPSMFRAWADKAVLLPLLQVRICGGVNSLCGQTFLCVTEPRPHLMCGIPMCVCDIVGTFVVCG